MVELACTISVSEEAVVGRNSTCSVKIKDLLFYTVLWIELAICIDIGIGLWDHQPYMLSCK